MNGGYSNGCLLNSPKAATYLGLVSKGKFTESNVRPCIAETDHWKSKGVPQHFFVLGEEGILDPIDTEVKWKKNPYRIVSYRVFLPPTPVNVPKEEKKPTEVKIDPIKAIPKVVQEVNQPQEQPMNEDLKKRLSSLAWRAGMMAVAVILETAMQSLSGFGLPAEVTVILGLVLGEVSKQIRTSLK